MNEWVAVALWLSGVAVGVLALRGLHQPRPTPTLCQHYPPSPGQSMCQCRHQQIEFEFALAIIERSDAERVLRTC